MLLLWSVGAHMSADLGWSTMRITSADYMCSLAAWLPWSTCQCWGAGYMVQNSTCQGW